jgi:hypothetical protein
VAVEPAHLSHQPCHVAGKDLADQPPAPLGQRDRHVAAVVTPAFLRHEIPADEVAHHDGGVAVAAQELLTEVALAERPVMQQRLQHAELSDGEPGRRHDPAHPCGDRLGGAHELDVGVERRRLGPGAGIARRHGSNSNGLYAARRALSSAAPGYETGAAREDSSRDVVVILRDWVGTWRIALERELRDILTAAARRDRAAFRARVEHFHRELSGRRHSDSTVLLRKDRRG